MGKFSALVRFDVQARDVGVTVGGVVATGAVDEVCELIERSVDLSGRPVSVDLSGTEIAPETLDRIRHRCGAIADITGPGGEWSGRSAPSTEG